MAKFFVGLNGKPGNIETILEKFSKDIYEVFIAAPPDISGSGRAGATFSTLNELERQTKLAHSFGVRYVVLINAICYGAELFTHSFRKKMEIFLKFLTEINIDGIVIANPYLILLSLDFRNKYKTHWEVFVSSLTEVIEASEAKSFDEMGVNRILLHQIVNRDFKTLKKIIQTVKCKLELYANTGSLYRCPFRYAHRAFISHLSTIPPEKLKQPEYVNWYKQNCISIRQKNPLEIIMAPTIRPEDLHFYEDLGIEHFKISGRSMSTEWMVNVLDAYIKRDFNGNIADLCETNLGRKMPFVPNKKLNGFLEKVKDNFGSYKDICQTFYDSLFSTDQKFKIK